MRVTKDGTESGVGDVTRSRLPCCGSALSNEAETRDTAVGVASRQHLGTGREPTTRNVGHLIRLQGDLDGHHRCDKRGHEMVPRLAHGAQQGTATVVHANMTFFDAVNIQRHGQHCHSDNDPKRVGEHGEARPRVTTTRDPDSLLDSWASWIANLARPARMPGECRHNQPGCQWGLYCCKCRGATARRCEEEIGNVNATQCCN